MEAASWSFTINGMIGSTPRAVASGLGRWSLAMVRSRGRSRCVLKGRSNGSFPLGDSFWT